MRICSRCSSVFTTQVEFCRLDGERVVESKGDALEGRYIDRYILEKRLGAGGMSIVYRARHRELGQECAIKMPYGEIAADRELWERFRREGKAIAQLKHPNIVGVLDFGTTEQGLSFLVMELLEGRSLADLLRTEGPLSTHRAARILRAIAAGLEAVHEAGFIHRDLKPSNVMLTAKNEEVKLLDFGLVHAPRDTALTQTGVALGTPLYMAPEQLRGEEATSRTDLYALGAVLYEMLSGSPPYRGTFSEIVFQQTTQRPKPPPDAGGLGPLAMRLLSLRPEDRASSAREVIELVDRAEPPSVARPAVQPRSASVVALVRMRRRRTLFRAGMAAAILIAVVIGRERILDRHEREQVVTKMAETLREIDRRLMDEMTDYQKRSRLEEGRTGQGGSNGHR
jgi:eukaryotic-like serine/threonine-protein kinase